MVHPVFNLLKCVKRSTVTFFTQFGMPHKFLKRMFHTLQIQKIGVASAPKSFSLLHPNCLQFRILFTMQKTIGLTISKKFRVHCRPETRQFSCSKIVHQSFKNPNYFQNWMLFRAIEYFWTCVQLLKKCVISIGNTFFVKSILKFAWLKTSKHSTSRIFSHAKLWPQVHHFRTFWMLWRHVILNLTQKTTKKSTFSSYVDRNQTNSSDVTWTKKLDPMSILWYRTFVWE